MASSSRALELEGRYRLRRRREVAEQEPPLRMGRHRFAVLNLNAQILLQEPLLDQQKEELLNPEQELLLASQKMIKAEAEARDWSDKIFALVAFPILCLCLYYLLVIDRLY
jgi:hypothetical protein